jgi:hypothetical protein
MPIQSTHLSGPARPDLGMSPKFVDIPSSRALCSALDAYNAKQRIANDALAPSERNPLWRQVALFGEAPIMGLAGLQATAKQLGEAVRRGLLRAAAYARSREYPQTVARDLVDTVAPDLDEATRKDAYVAAGCWAPTTRRQAMLGQSGGLVQVDAAAVASAPCKSNTRAT